MTREQKTFLAAGSLMLVSEIWKQYCLTFIVYDGVYQWSFFPFQLCSVPMYIALILGFVGKGRLRDCLLSFLADFSLLSGAIVLLDTSGMHYGYAPLTVHSYLWHAGLVLLGFYAGTRSRNKGRKAFTGAVPIYLLCCCLAELINFSFDRFGIVNMFYINPHYYMVQIGFRSLLRFLPNRAVIAVYIVFTILGAGVLHLIWRRVRKEGKYE